MMKSEQRQLLIELRSQLLSTKAKETGKSTMPYCIYTDETIENLLKAQPKTIAELTKVKGFPKDGKRVKGFGEAIIAIFNGKKIESFSLKTEGDKVEVVTKLKPITSFN